MGRGMLQFKPYQESVDVSIHVELRNRLYPDMIQTEDEILRERASVPKERIFIETWLATDGEEPVAVLDVMDNYWAAEKGRMLVDVLTPSQDPEIWSEVYRFGEDCAIRKGATEIICWNRSDCTGQVEAMIAAGFTEIQRVPITRLKVDTFPLEDWEKALKRVADQGIGLTTWADLDHEAKDWVAELYQATWEMVQDMPSPTTPTAPKYSEYVKMLEDKKRYIHDLMFVALDGDKIVGYSRLTPTDADPTLLYTGLSGMRRNYRRKGIVTALKVAGIKAANARGATQIQTDNDETNPMYKLNTDLGFKNSASWIQFRKALA